jgi:ParB family chromosome partitioning protein
MSGRSGRPRLGKGLGALLGDVYREGAEGTVVRRVQVTQVSPNPYQPRRDFTNDELAELRESIRVNGLLQPPLVRPAPEGSRTPWELVAGERRFRCIRDLGWDEMPVLVREVEDRTLLVLALVENIQRESLNPMEEAEGYRVLQDQFGLSQAEIAEQVGKSRPAVANALRLLRLPPSIRRKLEEGALSMGHARALLAVEDPGRQLELARRAMERGWSVREMEERVRALTAPDREAGEASGASDSQEGRDGTGVPGGAPSSVFVRALQEELRRTLGTRAAIREGKDGSGRIEIPYRTGEDFERLFHLITGVEAHEVAG